MQMCHPIFVLGQERVQKTEMMQHAGVWFQFGVKGYDDMCKSIWKRNKIRGLVDKIEECRKRVSFGPSIIHITITQ